MGTDDNIFFPTQQLNPAPAIPSNDGMSLSVFREQYLIVLYPENGLEGLGFFGRINGHIDEGDDAEALTFTYQNGPLPPGYEAGRFHLMYFGLYVHTVSMCFLAFCGLQKHGGTPPLGPNDQPIDPSAYRLMYVLYPPAAMLSRAEKKCIGLASIPGPNGMQLLTISPEMSTPM
jgi:hypothetical protein